MIPIHLKISGFLSYREAVEIDFSGFDLACISGENGAGKSSLLDAITWVLFGQARKRDEAVINLQSQAAEVTFVFAYENNKYRVIRSLTRGKPTRLEFQIRDEADWRPLTEHTNRETQARIERVLKLEYETFINVSFFLQGHADQFAQQAPTRRKEILGNILGLEVWEAYKERTAEQRKAVEGEIASVDGRVSEIEAELAEEDARKQKLADLEAQLSGVAASRKVQDASLAQIKQIQAGLDKQRTLVNQQAETLEREEATFNGLERRLTDKEEERKPAAEIIKREEKVRKAYADWQALREELEGWDKIARRFHEQDKSRLPFLEVIQSEQAKLEQEKVSLSTGEKDNEKRNEAIIDLQEKLASAKKTLAEAETNLDERERLEEKMQAGREKQVELNAENTRLKDEMEKLDDRRKKLQASKDQAICPLCGQTLSQEHRKSTLEQLNTEGKQMGDAFRANKAKLEALVSELREFEGNLELTADATAKHLAAAKNIAQLNERLDAYQKQTQAWTSEGAKRLVEVGKLLDSGKYAIEARKELAKVDKELAKLGYDTAKHEAVRDQEERARSAETDQRLLETSLSALKPLDDEIANLKTQIKDLQKLIGKQQKEYDQAVALLAAEEAQGPDIEAAEKTLFDLQDQENRLNQEVGGARQKVSVLDDLRKRKGSLATEREELGLRIGRYKALERAFGRDGVPALLIEQALPEIEMKANEILGRLTGDSMHLHFETQAKYKD